MLQEHIIVRRKYGCLSRKKYVFSCKQNAIKRRQKELVALYNPMDRIILFHGGHLPVNGVDFLYKREAPPARAFCIPSDQQFVDLRFNIPCCCNGWKRSA